jgi:lipid-binding SYLF domain-containing protein
MFKPILATVAFAALIVVLAGCSTAPKTEEDRAKLTQNVTDTIARAQKEDPDMKKFFDESAGYAVFPKIGKGALVVGAAYGKGELYDKGEMVGYCDVEQGSVGAAIGGQSYSELIFFETPRAVERFKTGKYTFAAQVSAVALKSGAARNAKYADNVLVFTFAESGLMAEAAVGGQKFSYLPK